MSQYRLRPHLCICEIDGDLIILDLKTGAYGGLGGMQADTLLAIVCETSEANIKAAALRYADDFVQAGILTTSADGKSIPLVKIEEVTQTLVEKGEPWPAILVTDVLKFVVSCACASLVLRFLSMERILKLIQALKARHQPHAKNFDIAAARRAMAVFRRLRPFLFKVQNACLLDSLCLVIFLSFYGLYPTWIIGVKKDPFEAHSWVQDGSFVFNGTPRVVRKFKPIEAV